MVLEGGGEFMHMYTCTCSYSFGIICVYDCMAVSTLELCGGKGLSSRVSGERACNYMYVYS